MGTHNSAWQNNLNQHNHMPMAIQAVYADTLLSMVMDTGELVPVGSINTDAQYIRVDEGVDYVPEVAGFYKVEFELQSAPILSTELVTVPNGARPGNGLSLQVFKNGELVGNPVSRPNVTSYAASDRYVYLPSLSVSTLVAMDGRGDVLRLMASQDHFSSEVPVFGRAMMYRIADFEVIN